MLKNVRKFKVSSLPFLKFSNYKKIKTLTLGETVLFSIPPTILDGLLAK